MKSIQWNVQLELLVMSRPTNMKPTCVHVEQLTLSPELKAMMLYLLVVFLCETKTEVQKLRVMGIVARS